MNKDEYLEQLHMVAYGRQFHPDFIEEWFSHVLKMLATLSEQSGLIDHPRHRGDSREDALIGILRDIIPASFQITKGFAVNDQSSMSREQDCLICSGSLFSKLAGSDAISYVPINSVFASVEIKSNLDLNELRRCIINCASLKSIHYEYDPTGKYEGAKDRIIYSVFAYKSEKSLEQIKELLLELSESIPEVMWINQIYVMDQGLIKPCRKSGEVVLGPEIALTGRYASISGLGHDIPEYDKAMPFLWFLSNIVDNIVAQNNKNVKSDTFSYFFRPMIFQKTMRERLKKQKDNSCEDKEQ